MDDTETPPCPVCYALAFDQALKYCDSEPEEACDTTEWHNAKERESLGHIDQIFPDSEDLLEPDEMDASILELFTDNDFYKPLAGYYMEVVKRSPNCWPSLARLCNRGADQIAADPLLGETLDCARFLRLLLDVGGPGFILQIFNCDPVSNM